MRIVNLVAAAKQFNSLVEKLVVKKMTGGDFTFSDDEITTLHHKLDETVEKVNRLCKKKGATPADLPTPSFRAYQWMKFLNQRKWLLSHIYALKDYYDLFDFLYPKILNRISSAHIQIESYHSSYLFRSSKKNGIVILEINEGFISAPSEIKRMILEAALKRRSASHLKNIKRYAASSEYQKIHSALQANGGVNTLSGIGRTYNLVDLFSCINQRYFNQQLSQPRLVWSARRSRRKLGYYHPESDTVTINKRLDSAEVPEYLVKYVLYHELLHKKLGLKNVNGRRYAHTRAFRQAEKQFEYYREAEKLIKKLDVL